MNAPLMLRSKQFLLSVTIVYFYVMSLGIKFGWKMRGIDHPAVFAMMGLAFLSALVLEAALVWWHARKRAMWILLGLLSYAIIGFVVAPIWYGDFAISVALGLPVVAVFVLGFLMTFAHLLIRALRPVRAMTAEDVTPFLADLPGWDFVADRLTKTFRFLTTDEATQFEDRCRVLGTTMHRTPDFEMVGSAVRVRLWSPAVNGVTETDVTMAKKIDEF